MVTALLAVGASLLLPTGSANELLPFIQEVHCCLTWLYPPPRQSLCHLHSPSKKSKVILRSGKQCQFARRQEEERMVGEKQQKEGKIPRI